MHRAGTWQWLSQVKWQTQVEHYYYYYYLHLRNKLEHLTKPRITLYVLVIGLVFFLSEPLYLLRYNKFWGGLTGQKTLIPHVSIFFSVTLQLHFGCFVKLTSVSEILYSHTCYLEYISACKLIAMQSLYGSNAQYHWLPFWSDTK